MVQQPHRCLDLQSENIQTAQFQSWTRRWWRELAVPVQALEVASEEHRPAKGRKKASITATTAGDLAPYRESFSPALAAWSWWSTGSWCSNAMPVLEAPRRWWSVWVGLASASSASLVCKYHLYVSHNPHKKSICTPRSDVCSSEGLPVRPCGVQRWRSQIGSLRCPAKTCQTISRGPPWTQDGSSTLSRCRFSSCGWEPWCISCSYTCSLLESRGSGTVHVLALN